MATRVCDVAAEEARRGRGRRGGGGLFANLVRQIKLLKVIALFAAAVPADGRDVEHTLAELDERASLHRKVELRKVLEHPVDNLLQVVLAEVAHQR
eukprot:3857831-Prymnesium_polylepis.1